MRVEFLNELPGRTIGEIDDIEVNDNGVTEVYRCSIHYLIEEGWVKEVKERTLEDKFNDYTGKLIESSSNSTLYAPCPKTSQELSQIAKDHYVSIIIEAAKKADTLDEWAYREILRAIEKG